MVDIVDSGIGLTFVPQSGTKNLATAFLNDSEEPLQNFINLIQSKDSPRRPFRPNQKVRVRVWSVLCVCVCVKAHKQYKFSTNFFYEIYEHKVKRPQIVFIVYLFPWIKKALLENNSLFTAVGN